MYSKLYLVRHGQTVFNTRLLIQGRCDSPLTALGRDQARAAAAWLSGRGVRFDAAFSSPAERACATTELLWAGSYTRLMGLAERSFGELEGTDVLSLPKPAADYPVTFGGEPEAALKARFTATMRAIANWGRCCFSNEPLATVDSVGCPVAGRPVAGRTDAPVEPCAIEPPAPGEAPSGNVLVVSHGAACKAFAQACEAHAHVQLPSPFPNCCILIYAYDGERFELSEVADPAAHLGGEGLPI